jgi:ribosomal protein S4
MTYKAKQFSKQRRVFFMNKRPLVVSSIQSKYMPLGFVTPFNKITEPLNIKSKFRFRRRLPRKSRKKNLNFYHLFLRRSLRFATYIYKRCYYRQHAYANDLLLGVKSAFRIYKPLRRSNYQKRELFFQQITLFYNQFDTTKLKRFGKLGRKGQFGGVNYFLFLLESRIDSIILRLNLACKFIIREVIQSGKILVDNVPISYLNFIVKKSVFVHFIKKFKKIVYATLYHKVPIKMFFVQPPFYLEINYRTLMILIVPRLIDPSFVPYPFLRSKSSLIAGLHTVLWGW